MKTTIEAHAKVNLFLEITGRRDDGYHNIKSIMQSVALCDTITLETTEGGSDIAVTCSMPTLPTDESNLAYRAARAFFDSFGIANTSLKIDIEKRIPVGAGLAGGSADAAAVLRGLSRFYPATRDAARLSRIGASIGADIPFCLIGGCALASGIGDAVTPLRPLPPCYIAVAIGGESVGTKDAYGAYDRFKRGEIMSELPTLAAVAEGDLDALAKSFYNVFEDVILPGHAAARRIKSIFAACRADGVLMSGSGPSVFALFRDKDCADDAVTKLKDEGFSAYCCAPSGAYEE